MAITALFHASEPVEALDTLVIGAGHAGLAVSRLLTEAGRDHVVLDRGRVGERWRSERWESLHLLTPNWMTRLPGWYYAGADPDGFQPAAAFARSLSRYARSFGAPVHERTTVMRLGRGPGGRYDVTTDRGTWRARHVVVATGPHGRQHVPQPLARARGFQVVPSSAYRRPDLLPAGGVLVVGASSSGVQIADELLRAGRAVTLAVGRHTRMPRSYRGMDAFWWLQNTGRLSRTIDDLPDPDRARREPSLQLVGRPSGHAGARSLDLLSLQDRGARLTGRLAEVSGSTMRFADDLVETTAAADRQMHRFLDAVDQYIEEAGLAREVLPPDRPRSFRPAADPPRLADQGAEGIGAVVLAAGFRPDHGWIDLPVLAPDGSIRQHRGVTEAPGLYVVGQRFQHRRDSGFIDGARHDARTVVAHLTTGALPTAEPGRRAVSSGEGTHERP